MESLSNAVTQGFGISNGTSRNAARATSRAMISTNNSNTIVNLNGSYMFQDKESMDYFLNRMGLVLSRG